MPQYNRRWSTKRLIKWHKYTIQCFLLRLLLSTWELLPTMPTLLPPPLLLRLTHDALPIQELKNFTS
jgi:hypothetical protein